MDSCHLSRDTLLDIDDNLRQSELKSLKFLSKKLVSEGDLEKITHSYELFEVLTGGASCNLNGGGLIIAQFLYLIGRNDLILKLNIDYNGVREMIKKSTFLSQHRMMLFELTKNMESSDVSRLQFLLLNGIHPKSKLSEIKDGEDLINILELIYPNEDELKEKLRKGFDTMNCRNLNEILRSANITETESLITDMFASLESICSNGTLHHYSMSNSPRGICLIINNENFNPTNLCKRLGTDIDADSIKELFESLKFKVIVHKDLNAQDIKDTMNHWRNYDHNNHDCLFVFILSHGDTWSVLGIDGNEVSLKSILDLFTETNCPSLVGKPRVFCIQACQGQDIAYSDLSTDASSPNNEKIIKGADFLLSLSTLPGYASLRSISNGSWYIQTLVAVARRYHKKLDFLKMLTIVSKEINEKRGRAKGMPTRQVSMVISTLTQDLYL